MALPKAPSRPQRRDPLIDVRTGMMTESGYRLLDDMWRQIAAGYPIVPCTAAGTNTITLTPTLHQEGGLILANHMGFSFVAAATSTGNVTVGVGDHTAIKGFKTNGAAQATTGDVVNGSFYVAYFVSSLDGGAGGFVIK